MKSLINIALTGTALLLTSNSFAARPLTQNQALSECKSLASAQFDNVKSVKLSKFKSSRGEFKMKFRVRSENEKGLFLCTVGAQQDIQIVRLDKTASKSSAVASKQ